MRAAAVALLSLLGGAFADGGCGLAEVYADSEAFSNPEGGRCFEKQASKITPLGAIYRQLLLAKEGVLLDFTTTQGQRYAFVAQSYAPVVPGW